MFEKRRRRKALERVKPGDGRALKPFRGWQPLNRALLYLPHSDGATYAVDVHHWQQFTTEDGKGMAHLYRDGHREASSGLPATFSVPGGVIEVEGTPFGLKRCHFVPDDGGQARQLLPDKRSAEGRRARLDRERPTLSRLIGLTSIVILVIGLILGLPQILEVVTQIPPITERFGRFQSPIDLPWQFNLGLGLVVTAASVERATRLRHSGLLDGDGTGSIPLDD